MIFVKYITDEPTVFFTALFKPSIFTLAAKHMVVKCTAVNIQHFAYYMHLVFSVKRFQSV